MFGPLGINLPVKAGVLYVGRLTLNVFEGLVLPMFFSANQDGHPFRSDDTGLYALPAKAGVRYNWIVRCDLKGLSGRS